MKTQIRGLLKNRTIAVCAQKLRCRQACRKVPAEKRLGSSQEFARANTVHFFHGQSGLHDRSLSPTKPPLLLCTGIKRNTSQGVVAISQPRNNSTSSGFPENLDDRAEARVYTFAVHTRAGTTKEEGDQIYETLCRKAQTLGADRYNSPNSWSNVTAEYCMLYFALAPCPPQKLPDLLAAFNNDTDERIDAVLHFYTDNQCLRLEQLAYPPEKSPVNHARLYPKRHGMTRFAFLLKPNITLHHAASILTASHKRDDFVLIRRFFDVGRRENGTRKPIMLAEIPDVRKEGMLEVIKGLEMVEGVVDAEDLVELALVLEKPYWMAHMVWMESFGFDAELDLMKGLGD